MTPATATAPGPVHDIVTSLQAARQTILLITHDMAEADALAGRVAIIDHCRLQAGAFAGQRLGMSPASQRDVSGACHPLNMADRIHEEPQGPQAIREVGAQGEIP